MTSQYTDYKRGYVQILQHKNLQKFTSKFKTRCDSTDHLKNPDKSRNTTSTFHSFNQSNIYNYRSN